ncbi:hypothetical protein [Bosea robiniae]|uniref:hypothetical protein n=2 Tax=Bosea TaxID=85413 RepID=UPI00286A6A72|nr:hypothetical protein [Bosea robiniae]
MMTLILEFKHKLIFYKPGILRYAMRQARLRFSGLQSRAQRRQLLSQSLKRGWAEAKAELSALQRLQAVATLGRPGLFRDDIGTGATTTSPNEAPAIALARQQFH